MAREILHLPLHYTTFPVSHAAGLVPLSVVWGVNPRLSVVFPRLTEFSAPPSPVMIPVQTVPTYGDNDEDGADMFNLTTEENTRPNAAVGEGVVVVPSGSGAPTKKC